MELNESVLADLPDAALYHLLKLCSLEQVLRFQSVLGKQRYPVFQEVTKLFNSKYGFHDLSLSIIYKILGEEDKDKSSLAAAHYGDYPEYIASIYHQIRDVDWVLQGMMTKGREKSALVMLKRNANADDIPIAIKYRCTGCFRFLNEKYSFVRKVVKSLYEDGYLTEDDLIWAIDYGKLKVDSKFLSFILSFSNKISSGFLRALLERASDEDVEKVYNLYHERLARRVVGLDTVFEERLR